MMTSAGCDLFEIFLSLFNFIFRYFWQDVVFENWMFSHITRLKCEMLHILALILFKKKKWFQPIFSDISICLLMKQIKVFFFKF